MDLRSKIVPRGIRNNNPGNLVISRIPWKGKIPVKQNTDGVFEQYIDMPHGIRAMMMDIRNDITKDGLNTVRKLITEYSKTDVESYIKTVCRITGFKEDDTIVADKNTIFRLITAMSYVENGGYYISDEDINKAWEML
jgi:hypothetical protein